MNVIRGLTKNANHPGRILQLEEHLGRMSNERRLATIKTMIHSGLLVSSTGRAANLSEFMRALNRDPISLENNGTWLMPMEFWFKNGKFHAPRAWNGNGITHYSHMNEGRNHPVTRNSLNGRILINTRNGRVETLGAPNRPAPNNSPVNRRPVNRRVPMRNWAIRTLPPMSERDITRMTDDQVREFMRDFEFRHLPCQPVRPGYMCNPLTGRAVLTTGRIGRALLRRLGFGPPPNRRQT